MIPVVQRHGESHLHAFLHPLHFHPSSGPARADKCLTPTIFTPSSPATPSHLYHGPDKPAPAYSRRARCRHILYTDKLRTATARRLGGKGREANHRRRQWRAVAHNSPSLFGAVVSMGVCIGDRGRTECPRSHHHRTHRLLWRTLS